MLSHRRALYLTDDKGFLCGKILAALGAEVIKIEPPGGDPSRRLGSFWGGVPEPERNLTWFACNSNKKGITLNLGTGKGRDIFRKLAATADFVIESFPVGCLDELGTGCSDLTRSNQKLVWASITPFGPEGPYRGFKDTDIVIMGMSGVLYRTGESDGPPVHISMPQAGLHAGAAAAVGCLMAYYHGEMTGEGQKVDVSMQRGAAWFQANAIPSYELDNAILKRAGAFRGGTSGKVGQRQVWKCKDRYLFFNVIGGRTGAKTLSALVAWMDEENMATEYLLDTDWDNFDMFTVTTGEMGLIPGPMGEFFLRHTTIGLLKGAVPRGVSIGPLSGMHDLLEDECLKARRDMGVRDAIHARNKFYGLLN